MREIRRRTRRKFAPEEMEIICRVDETDLPVRVTLRQLDVHQVSPQQNFRVRYLLVQPHLDINTR